MVQVWHITVSSANRMPLFAHEGQRRACVRRLVVVIEGRLVLFSFADEHGHIVVTCVVGEVGRIKRTIGRALPSLVAAPLGQLHVRPVENRAHLRRLVPYSLGQTTHHQLPEEPALFSGSCFQDLVGARVIGPPLRIWDLLPRMCREDVASQLGLTASSIAPASDAVVRAAGAVRVVSAAAAATAAPPDMKGRADPVVAARLAALAVGDAAGISRAEMAWALEVTARGLRKIAERPADPATIRAVRVRLALEDRFVRSALGPVARTP